MVTIKPIELKGKWLQGFALDIHTVSSDYIGDDPYGHPMFDTEYSPIGGLVKRIKYRSDLTVIDEISSTTIDFLNDKWKIAQDIDFIIPIPPSNINRAYQPVIEIAKKIGSEIHIPLSVDSLLKSRVTPELKDVNDPESRKKILAGVFEIGNKNIVGKNVLLFDDLYRSGATMTMATEVLYNKGRVRNVYVLTLTKTRSKQ
jgi:competence protein ComFC